MIRDFLANQANVTRNADLLTAAVGQYRARFPSVRNWGTFGLCWGGKVSSKLTVLRLVCISRILTLDIGGGVGIRSQHTLCRIWSSSSWVRRQLPNLCIRFSIDAVSGSLLDPADASALTIPHVVLASKDESADAVAAYADIITNNGKGGLVETYPTMWHGWMGARADLAAEESRTEYLRG